MQSDKKNNTIELDQDLSSKELKIFGLYDPEEYSLDINMWINSDGDQLRNLFTKLNKIKLSDDAVELVEITILTNAYYPKKNITEKEFLKFKSNWLIKNSNLELKIKGKKSNRIAAAMIVKKMARSNPHCINSQRFQSFR